MMSLRWAFGLAWLICAFSSVYVPALSADEAGNGNICQKQLDVSLSCHGEQDLMSQMDSCCEKYNDSNENALMAECQNVLGCCGKKVYNPVNELCCDSAIRVKPAVKSKCCGKEAISEDEQLCCYPNQIIQRPSKQYQCCGGDAYNTENQFCCSINGILTIKSDKCSSTSSAQLDDCEPEAKIWTDQHYCGPKVFRPEEEICCSGHRYNKARNNHCCGVKAYNIRNTQMKCCAGTLYNLTVMTGGDGQCCGSILYTKGVCCLSEDKEVLYSERAGLRCCGHFYYNTSLWSCCAGKLRPRKSGVFQNSTILSLSNLNKTRLCNPIKVGTVESVSQHSIVFSSLLEINGRNASLKLLDWHYTLYKPCSPELTPGKAYFFSDAHVFIDFNHDSLLQSLRFIIIKCSD